MDAATTKFVRKMFPDDDIPDDREITALCTYLLSKGLYNLGCWQSLGPKLELKVHGRIMRLYRATTNQK